MHDSYNVLPPRTDTSFVFSSNALVKYPRWQCYNRLSIVFFSFNRVSGVACAMNELQALPMLEPSVRRCLCYNRVSGVSSY